MLKTLEVNSGRIKYWIDELPLIDAPNHLSVDDDILVQCDRKFIRTKVALEIALNKNAGYYGLLGVEYFPIQSSNLRITINYTAKNELKYNDTILQYDNKVFMGLTEEYVDYTQKKMVDYLNSNGGIQPGLLNVAVAANSEVGSSQVIFGALSEMLIEIIIRNGSKQSGISMDEIVKDVFYTSSLFVR